MIGIALFFVGLGLLCLWFYYREPSKKTYDLAPIPKIDVDLTFEKIDHDLEAIDRLDNQRMGFFSTRWWNLRGEEQVDLKHKANELRAGVAEQIHQENAILHAKFDVAMIPERMERLVKQERLAYEEYLKDVERENRRKEAELKPLEMAADRGVDPLTYAGIFVAEEALKFEKEATTHALNEQLRKEKASLEMQRQNQMMLETFAREQKEALDKLELEKERQQAHNEIEANFILKYGHDAYQIELIQRQLDRMYEEVNMLETTNPPGWQKKLSDRKKTIVALKVKQNGLRQRLIQDNQQQAMGETGTP